MSKGTFDVIVVGLGAMGASTCYYLARRGFKVLGLDQFALLHTRGSSHGHLRAIRKAYYEHPDYVPLIEESYRLWEELESLSGRKLLVKVGGLYMGKADSPLVNGSIAAALRHSLAHEVLSAPEIRRRYPFIVDDTTTGLFETDAGILFPESAICAFATHALRLGAEIHGCEPVREWKSTGQAVRVRTDGHEYHASELVICGGPWSAALVPELHERLVVTRQITGWFWPTCPERFWPPHLPVWGLESSSSFMYGFPMTTQFPGVKVGSHLAGPRIDPDRPELPSVDEAVALRAFLAEHLPSANTTPLALDACYYTSSPDGHFIIDSHPEHANVTLVCGFSGHGFKFAPLVGDVVVDLVEQRTTLRPISFMRLARFKQPPRDSTERDPS
jgi:sarcosine oxidase